MANGEVIDTIPTANDQWQLIRFLDRITAPVSSAWMEAKIFRDGTLDVKADAGSPTMVIEVQGSNDFEIPSSTYDGPKLITDIAAVGMYDLAKLPVRWIKLKATTLSGGTVSVRGNLST